MSSSYLSYHLLSFYSSLFGIGGEKSTFQPGNFSKDSWYRVKVIDYFCGMGIKIGLGIILHPRSNCLHHSTFQFRTITSGCTLDTSPSMAIPDDPIFHIPMILEPQFTHKQFLNIQVINMINCGFGAMHSAKFRNVSNL